MKELSEKDTNGVHQIPMKPVRAAEPPVLLFVNPLPALRFIIGLRRHRQRVTTAMRKNGVTPRPGIEVQVNLLYVRVGFRWRSRVDAQPYGDSARKTRPSVRRARSFKRIHRLSGPFLPSLPISAIRHMSSGKGENGESRRAPQQQEETKRITYRYKRTPPTKACESRARNKLQNVHKTRAPPLCELVLKASIRARAYSHARKFLIPTLTAPPPFLPGHVLNGRNNPGLKWPDSGRRKGGRAPVGQAVRRVLGSRRPIRII